MGIVSALANYMNKSVTTSKTADLGNTLPSVTSVAPEQKTGTGSDGNKPKLGEKIGTWYKNNEASVNKYFTQGMSFLGEYANDGDSVGNGIQSLSSIGLSIAPQYAPQIAVAGAGLLMINSGLNSLVGKKNGTFAIGEYTNNILGDFGGLAKRFSDAEAHSGESKKWYLGTNSYNYENIMNLRMDNFAKNWYDALLMSGNMSLTNKWKLENLRSGNYDIAQRMKLGSKIKRIKLISKNLPSNKKGGSIVQFKFEYSEVPEEINLFKNGGFIFTYSEVPENSGEKFQKGGKTKSDYDKFLETLPDNLKAPTDYYDMHRYWELNGKPKDFEELKEKGLTTLEDDGFWHTRSTAYNQDLDEYEFVKSPNHPTVWMEEAAYNSKYPKLKEGSENDGNISNYDLIDMEGPEKEQMDKFREDYILDKSGPIWKYIRRHKQGGKTEGESEEKSNQKSIIPEGALHAHKHHMEDDENITKKGIPVVDMDGELLAEIERDEIIFNLTLTNKLEELYKEFYDENTKQKRKDELAIEAGKLLTEDIMHNLDDRTGLVDKCEKGGKLNEA